MTARKKKQEKKYIFIAYDGDTFESSRLNDTKKEAFEDFQDCFDIPISNAFFVEVLIPPVEKDKNCIESIPTFTV